MAKTEQQQAERTREALLREIEQLDLESLAVAAKHEYDDVVSVVVPPHDSPGAAFLRAGRDEFVSWVREAGRWPQSGVDVASAGGTWHHADSSQAQRAQAFCDLGLYFSYHATAAEDASIAGICRVLDATAEQLTFTLTSEYGPIV